MGTLRKNKSVSIKNNIYTASLMLLVFVFLGFFSQVAAKDSGLQNKTSSMTVSINDDNENEKIAEDHYVFYTTPKDRDIKWEVFMNDGKIKELYRDDTLLPKQSYPVYEEMVKREIDKIEQKD